MENDSIRKMFYDAETRACEAYAREEASKKVNEKLLKRIIRGICDGWNRKRFNRTRV